MANYDKDPDDLYGEDVLAKITIAVRRNGAMSVAGSIENLDYALAMFDAAKDSVRRYHDRNKIANGGLIIPSNDSPFKLK